MGCSFCGKDIRFGRYLTDVWGNSIHADHEYSFCSSCGCFIPIDTERLEDGRQLCEKCAESSEDTDEKLRWVDDKVRSMLIRRGAEGLPEGVVLKYASLKDMCEKNKMMQDSTALYGLTLTKVTGFVGMRKTSHTILLRDRLTKVHLAGVLGHEYLHAWLNSKNVNMPPMLTEGFCNIGSYVVYHDIRNKMSHYYFKQMLQSTDPVYGDGFRFVKDIFDNEGMHNLQQTLNLLYKRR